MERQVRQQIREPSLDLLRGIGMILVVVGHYCGDGYIRTIIYSFHIPLFFILSGYLFRIKDGEAGLTFIKRKVQSFLLPYISLSCVNLIFAFVLNRGMDIKSSIAAILFWVVTDDFPIGGALWYLIAIFLMEMIGLLASKMKSGGVLLWISLFLLGILNTYVVNVQLPYCITQVFICIPFFVTGLVMSKINSLIKLKKMSIRGGMLLCLVSAMLIPVAFYNGEVNFRSLVLNCVPLTYIVAIIMTFFLLWLCTRPSEIDFNPINAWIHIGRNSIIFLGLHQLVASLVFSVLGKFGYTMGAATRTVMILSSIIICYLISLVVCKQKYLKYVFLGRKIA